MALGTLMFLATEDWFVRSHFLPLIDAARDAGWTPLVAARTSAAAADLEAHGARVIALNGARGGLSPHALTAQGADLRAVLKREQPDLVHAIALKPALLTALVCDAAPRAGLVFAITGLGFLAASREIAHKAGRAAAISVITHRAVRRGASFVFENEHDRRKFEKRGVERRRAFVAPGAGVDVARFDSDIWPPDSPLKVGLAARLLKSKGVENAVAAITHLRAEGVAIELAIAGQPDPENPASHSDADLARWRALDGVACLGWTPDMPGFWRDQHVSVTPSHGGEGLPKSLLEAAASGRALVVSDAPGGRDFVRDGENGLVYSRGDVAGLAAALRRLALDPPLRRQLGAAARVDIERGYTHAHVVAAMQAAWEMALKRPL